MKDCEGAFAGLDGLPLFYQSWYPDAGAQAVVAMVLLDFSAWLEHTQKVSNRVQKPVRRLHNMGCKLIVL